MSGALQSTYGLKWNPFSPELPSEALITSPPVEHFIWRVRNMANEGGFGLIAGQSGVGKSVALRTLAQQLGESAELTVATMVRPQSGLADFYRELGHHFGVLLTPNNRWGGAKGLRDKWVAHIESARCRAVVLIDEAQETHPSVLNELRLLSSADFDSRNLVTTVLCGDERLLSKLQYPELLPLASRVRAKLLLESLEAAQLAQYLKEAITMAGNANLMTPELVTTVAEHAAGNWRTMMLTANELLVAGAKSDVPQLDEKLYLEIFSPPATRKRARRQ